MKTRVWIVQEKVKGKWVIVSDPRDGRIGAYLSEGSGWAQKYYQKQRNPKGEFRYKCIVLDDK